MQGDAVSTIVQSRIDNADMLARFTTATETVVAIEDSTAQILAAEGVFKYLWPGYYAYSRKLMKLQSKFSGETLAVEADVHLNRWVARGLVQSICERIRNEVHTIPAPSGP